MPTETKTVEWTEEKALEKLVHLKVATVSWECTTTEQGCVFDWSKSVVHRTKKCPRNMNHFAKGSAKWFWGLVAAVAAIIALIATGGGAAILGIGAAGWAAIAGGSAGIAGVAAALQEFDDKYKDCDDLPTPDPDTESGQESGQNENCDEYCTEELSKLWASLLQKE